MTNYRLAGTLLSILGFIAILVNAADYLFGWPAAPSGTFIFGLLAAFLGMYLSKKK